jgi:DNA recombination protein RmuC
MEKYSLILNIFVLFALIGVVFLILRNNLEEKKREIIENENKKNESEKFEELKRTVSERLENVSNSYNTFSNKITKDITDSFTRYEKDVKNFNEKVQNMNEVQSNLTKIFSNVKKFGTAGEFTLASLLKDLLAPSQYVQNAKIKSESQGTVEFAIKLPKNILVAVDSFFPAAILEKIKDADEAEDKKLSADTRQDLASAVKDKAEKISEKYIEPPKTTPFGVLYLPTESLFYEVCNHRDKKTKEPLLQILQREYNILVLGPTTLSVFLQSLHMGFDTLQVQVRSKKIYEDLQKLRFSFANHMKVIEEIYKYTNLSLKKIEEAGKSGRSITNVLENVQEPEAIDITPDKSPNNLKVLK